MTDHTDDTPRYTQADLEAVAERVREALTTEVHKEGRKHARRFWPSSPAKAEVLLDIAEEIRALDLTPYTKGKSDE